MNPQERQRKQREIQLQIDRDERERKRLARGGTPMLESIVVQSTPPSQPEKQTGMAAAQPSNSHNPIPEYALKVSITGAALPGIPAYNRQKVLVVPELHVRPSDDSEIDSETVTSGGD